MAPGKNCASRCAGNDATYFSEQPIGDCAAIEPGGESPRNGPELREKPICVQIALLARDPFLQPVHPRSQHADHEGQGHPLCESACDMGERPFLGKDWSGGQNAHSSRTHRHQYAIKADQQPSGHSGGEQIGEQWTAVGTGQQDPEGPDDGLGQRRETHNKRGQWAQADDGEQEEQAGDSGEHHEVSCPARESEQDAAGQQGDPSYEGDASWTGHAVPLHAVLRVSNVRGQQTIGRVVCYASLMAEDMVSLSSVLNTAERELAAGGSAAPRTWETGFGLLDTYLAGGVRAGELVLLGGPQGLGKTTFALQILRQVVASGGRGLLFSFEHDEQTLLERFLGIEAGEAAGDEAVPLRIIRQAMQETNAGAGDLASRLTKATGGAEALGAVAGYGDRLTIHRSSGRHTTIEVIRQALLSLAKGGDAPVVVVDYLQKVSSPESPDEEDRVTKVVEGLKDLALEVGVPIIAVVAADREGITAGRRLRVHNMRGSSSLAYEADVVLLMNDKYDVVARHHLVYDPGNAERFRAFVVLSIEKNRSGLDKLDLEFRKRFEQGRFDRNGQPVAEQLVDERVHVE
jgi:replicative DNA helicase